MPIADDKETVISVLSKEQKEKLRLVAQRHHRSLSKEIAYAMELYLDQFDDEGAKRRDQKREP